jgi:hypothetical protein
LTDQAGGPVRPDLCLRLMQMFPRIIDAPAPRRRGAVRSSALDYRDALSFSTILLAAAPEELFC